MSNITLSSGIRQNLLSLQDTAANLTTTQESSVDRQEGQHRLRQSDLVFHLAIAEQSRQRFELLARSDRPGPANARCGQ